MSEQKRIGYLDIARAIAIISITFNHAVSRSFNIYTDQLSEYLSVPIGLTVIKTVLYVFSRIGVPLFLMISGALLLNRDYDNKGLSRFIKHNWLQLFITTEIWLAIMFWYKQLLPDSILLSEGIVKCLINFVMTLLFLNPVTMSSMWYMFMILCVYLLIPILAISLKKIDYKYFFIPMIIVIFSSFIMPDINGILGTLGFNEVIDLKLASENVFSMYVVYLLLGYFISSKLIFEKLKTRTVVIGLCVFFTAYCAVQFWIYTKEFDYAISYNSIFPLLISVSLFELLRRTNIKGIINKISTYLSKVSLGIYFIHICIMEGLVVVIDYMGFNITYLWRFLFLEFISFFGALIIIWILKRSKFLSKNLLRIK